MRRAIANNKRLDWTGGATLNGTRAVKICSRESQLRSGQMDLRRRRRRRRRWRREAETLVAAAYSVVVGLVHCFGRMFQFAHSEPNGQLSGGGADKWLFASVRSVCWQQSAFAGYRPATGCWLLAVAQVPQTYARVLA